MNIESTKRLKLTNEEFNVLNRTRDILYDIYFALDRGDFIGNNADLNDADFGRAHDFLEKFTSLGTENEDSGIVTFPID